MFRTRLINSAHYFEVKPISLCFTFFQLSHGTHCRIGWNACCEKGMTSLAAGQSCLFSFSPRNAKCLLFPAVSCSLLLYITRQLMVHQKPGGSLSNHMIDYLTCEVHEWVVGVVWSWSAVPVSIASRSFHSKGPVRGVIQVPRLNFKAWYVAISEGSRVAVGISKWRHYVYADRVRIKTLPNFNLIRQGLRSAFLSEGAWAALSILKLGGSRGMLLRENFKIWVPEWLKSQCVRMSLLRE